MLKVSKQQLSQNHHQSNNNNAELFDLKSKMSILEQENNRLIKNLDDRAKELIGVKGRCSMLDIQLNSQGGVENIE